MYMYTSAYSSECWISTRKWPEIKTCFYALESKRMEEFTSLLTPELIFSKTTKSIFTAKHYLAKIKS